MADLRYGVNYVPSRNWWYSWVDWDAGSIEADLSAIAGLGMDHIRIHCLWPIFQPNPCLVSGAVLTRLNDLLDMADRCGLDVEVTVLDGWLSGFAFYPAWVGSRNIFTDRAVIEAEKFLFTTLARQIGSHPRFLGFDLGNELGVLHHFGMACSVNEGDAWNREMMELCDKLAPGKLHVNGVDHNQWFSDTGFSRAGLTSTGTATSVHAWIEFTGAREIYGPLGIGSIHLAEYCIELAKAYSTSVDRKVWLQEFGASKQWMDVDAIPGFAETTIRNAASCTSLWGFTWWCSHDLNPALEGFHSLEYDLGLLDHRNHVKPIGVHLSQLISRLKETPQPVISRTVGLVIDDCVFSEQSDSTSPGWAVGKEFMNLIEAGTRPAIVLADRAGDTDYLKSRGISELRVLQGRS